MPTYFQRPENALKRANEFIDVGKKQRALDALYDVIKSKKHRTWQKIHEPIMEKYLNLCVDLKKSHVAKEGLYQYKNICQQVNIKSLEDVIRRYLALAEERTEGARQTSHQAVASVEDIDDLDVIQTPESLLLSAVSGEDTQDRTDRAILTPWVKFLWESYRQCLDLLRNNSSVEKLYQDIAQQAFKFCLKYTRKTEFRKLCDNLRTHLGHIQKHQHQQRAINLNNPESQAMHLETRLCQLDSAIQMELWQEAFKAVEDIHGLISLSKKPPKPSLMANYYQKLGLIFWKSGNHMFHACAWHRLFHLSREQKKNLSQEELQRMGSRVVCATLSVPIPPSRNPIDKLLELDETTLEKQRRLATLLGLSAPPTRSALVKDLVKFNVIQHVHPELQNLYQWLEVEFHPLKLSKRMASSLEFIETKEELAQYVPALQDITITRLLKQVSQVYQTIEFSRLAALAPFASQFHLERVIVDAAKNLDLQVRIDHRTRSLSFGTDLGVAQKEDMPEGPYLQSMPSEQIRNQLTQMAQALNKVVKIVQPKHIGVEREELRAHIVQAYRQTAKKEHLRILQRRQIIEERKEELENLNVQREREEHELLEEQKRKQYEAEMARLEREAAERERLRKLEEHKEIQKKHAKERLEQLKNTALGARAFADMDEEVIAELDADEIMAKQVEQLEKEKKELQDRLKSQEKKVDHLERAKRLEEMPLLHEKAEKDRLQASAFWEIEEKEKVEKMKIEREMALKHRDRLNRIREDKDAFLKKLQEERVSVYKNKLAEFEKMLTEERKRRLLERKERRKEERHAKWIKEKEEAEQRKKDEELKRQREEEERLALEMREKEEAEYAEKLRKLEAIAEKQRQREREIEERQKQRQEEPDRGRDDWRRKEDDRDWSRSGNAPENEPRPTAWRAPSREGGAGWREREKAREEKWNKPKPVDEEDGAPPRRDEDRGSWRDRAPARDERDGERIERRIPPAEDRDRDARPSWRDRVDRDGEERGPWRRDDGPRRDMDRDGERGGGRDFGRRDMDVDRSGGRDFDRGGRDRDFDRGGRDFDRGGRDRDFDRGGRDRDFDRGGRDRDFDRGGRDRDFDRGNRDFRGGRDFGDRDRGGRDFDRDRGSRDFGDRDRGGRDFDRDRGGRSFGDRDRRDFGDRDRGGRDFDRDRGGRDFDRGGRDFGRGGRDFDRDRGGRDFDRDRGGRDFDRDRGGRDFDRDRGGRDFDRDRGGRDFDRDRGDRGGRDFDRGGRDLDRGGGSWRDDRGPPARDDRGPPPRAWGKDRAGGDTDRGGARGRDTDDRGPWRRGGDDRGTPGRGEEFRREPRDSPSKRREDHRPSPPAEKRPPPQEEAEDDGWTTVRR